MKETDQLKKLMESMDSLYSPVQEAGVDPMTGDAEPTMPDDVMMFDWNASPEQVFKTLNHELGDYGIQFKIWDDGSDQVNVSIFRVDH